MEDGYGHSIKKKLGIKPLYDPAIPLLGIYPEKNMIWKDTCTPVFTAALFAVAETWKQPKCPLTEEWIKNMWYINTMGYFSAIKKWNNSLCSNMDGPRYCHTEWSKSEKEISFDITYLWNLKKWYRWAYLQNRNSHRCRKQTYGYRLGLPNTHCYI